LEEREFQVSALEGFDAIVACLQRFIKHDTTKARLADSLIILSDDDFAWFCRYGLQVQARNQLDDNKKSKNLWYEESLPTDTLMYCLLSLRQSEDLAVIRSWWKNHYVRVGGNETVGLGWFAISEVGA